MGVTKFLGTALLVGIVSAVLLKYFCPCGHEQAPFVLEDRWWGGVLKEGQAPPADNPAVTKYTVSVPDTTLVELTRRLNAAQMTDPLQDVQFQYGFNTLYLKEIIEYWTKTYIPAWRSKHERWLNSFDQYRTQIEGLNVHFLHVKPKVDPKKVKVVPLMIIHGWPGSVVEFYNIIPLLTQPRPGHDFVFEVIAPHIPGYGFSDKPRVSGFSVKDAARVFNKLMDRLGHKKYFVQGGDWGSPISTIMAMVYPERVSGVHVNMALPPETPKAMLKIAVGKYVPWLSGFTETDVEKVPNILPMASFLLEETGYLHLQATKPDTVGVALGDSPAGLAAYLLEKFSTWTDRQNRKDIRGRLTEKFSLDQLLSNVMVYWVSGSITSSLRFYKESFHNLMGSGFGRIPVKVPSAITSFPNELSYVPRAVLEEQWRDIVLFTAPKAGGHFGAMEEPTILADDLFSFARQVLARKA